MPFLLIASLFLLHVSKIADFNTIPNLLERFNLPLQLFESPSSNNNHHIYCIKAKNILFIELSSRSIHCVQDVQEEFVDSVCYFLSNSSIAVSSLCTIMKDHWNSISTSSSSSPNQIIYTNELFGRSLFYNSYENAIYIWEQNIHRKVRTNLRELILQLLNIIHIIITHIYNPR
jgi:hypothetical protein